MGVLARFDTPGAPVGLPTGNETSTRFARRSTEPPPGGFSAATSAAQWAREVGRPWAESARRKDQRRTRHAFVSGHVAAFIPSLGVSIPGHDELARITGRSLYTITKTTRDAIRDGVISVAAPGDVVWTNDGNDVRRFRQEYHLLLRTRRAEVPSWGWHAIPRTKLERLSAAARLQLENVSVRQCSTAGLASVLRPFFLAGWNLADISTAMEKRPDGSRWTFTTAVMDAVAWLRFRLRHWMNEEGTPQIPQSRVAEMERARRDALAAERRREAQAITAGAVPPTAEQRTLLEEAKRAARTGARKVRRGLLGDGQKLAPSESSTLVESPLRTREARAGHRAGAGRTSAPHHHPPSPAPSTRILPAGGSSEPLTGAALARASLRAARRAARYETTAREHP